VPNVAEASSDHPLLTARFDAAVDYAVHHHRRQLRKGGLEIPYVAHLFAVCGMALELGGDEDDAIAALLHDVVEDGGGPAAQAEIEQRFGARVGRIVAANTDTDEEPKPPWPARKQRYIDSIATKQPDELLVSLADKIHNARAILFDYRLVGEELWERFKAGSGPAVRWYYRALVDAFELRRADLPPRVAAGIDELRRVVEEIEALSGG